MLKLKCSGEVNDLEKTIDDLKQHNNQRETHENEVIPNLKRQISELKTMLIAAEEDAEAQKKLATELGKTNHIFILSDILFLN